MERSDVYKLIEQHYRDNHIALVNVAAKSVHNFHDGEDVVQEAYTRACEYWNSYDFHRGNFSNWFESIFRNCISAKKQDNRLQGMSVDISEAENIPVPGPDKDYDDGEKLDRIDALISTKPENAQYILRLFFMQQYKPREIEKLVPENGGAIRTMIHRFKQEVIKSI